MPMNRGDANTMGSDLGTTVDQSEVRFLVEKNADGIIVVDEDGVVLFVNPAAERIFGRPRHLLVGAHIGIPLVAGETTEISIRKPGDGHVDAEVRCVETEWQRRPARLASLRDISLRKAQEEQLRHAARMEAVGRLTAGIAHDFNNLLTVVLGNLENARRQIEQPGTKPLRAIDNALHGAKRAAVLTERLLAFARRKPLDPCVLDVNELVTGMSDLLHRTLSEKVNVRTTLAEGLWYVEADPTELEAAILNLVVNARDAMPEGGDLVIATANFELPTPSPGFDDMEPGRYVLISVADTGIGMAADILQSVFEPFFTTKLSQGGTGLGLSHVYGFVKQSGGHVKLDSSPGQGTLVRIYLRSTDGHREPQPRDGNDSKVPTLPRGSGSEVILVVEDNEDVRCYTVESLMELGYTVLQAADADAAMNIIAHITDIHLLVTDFGLPGGIDGQQLTELVREHRPRLPALITTAYAGALVSAGHVDPAIELLTKPFAPLELAQRVRRLLDRGATELPLAMRVLIVDDEPTVRMFMADILADHGYTTEEAGNFDEAISKVQALGEQLDAAIFDLSLPGRSGSEAIAVLRTRQPHLPVILTTGHATQELEERYAGDRHLRILRKPFDRAGLMGMLQALGVVTHRSQ